MAEDDYIDNESLQAQIDLSMAYVHDMVCSWVKPSLNPTQNSSRNVEKEIQDQLRRPPRLGVGARVPEGTASSSRETARLKGHLTKTNGKKRARDDLGSKIQISDDEHESKAGAIRQKPKNPEKRSFNFLHSTLARSSTSHTIHPDHPSRAVGSETKTHRGPANASEPDAVSKSSSPEKPTKKRKKKRRSHLESSPKSPSHLVPFLSSDLHSGPRQGMAVTSDGTRTSANADNSSDHGVPKLSNASPPARSPRRSVTSIKSTPKSPLFRLDVPSGKVSDGTTGGILRKRGKESESDSPSPAKHRSVGGYGSYSRFDVL